MTSIEVFCASGNSACIFAQGSCAFSVLELSHHVQDNMEVRYMNWETDLQRLHSRKGSAQQLQDSPKQPEWLQDIPQMEDSATFDIILGSDVVYEVRSAKRGLLVVVIK